MMIVHASDEDAPVKRRKRRVRMVESPDAKEYRRLFETKDTAGFLRKLVLDINEGAENMDPPQHKQIFGDQDPEKMGPKAMATLLIRSSCRIMAMFSAISDQVDQRNEKALIFAANPWEQMLYVVLLRAFRYKADAVLATMKGEEKKILIDRFQSPLARWEAGSGGINENDCEILVLSYYMNSGSISTTTVTTCMRRHHRPLTPSGSNPVDVWFALGNYSRF
ncbi:hypothetical protein N0V86_008786 [Didymella sp. IMI 355093]|nr:hypothetical protein N0V86_008786 [Didymella sp. IMI 355093]